MLIVDALDKFLIASRNLYMINAMADNTNKTSNTWQAGNITGAIDETTFGNVSNTISTTGNSVVYIIMMLIGFIGVVGIGIAAIKVMVGGAATKSEAKGSLFWILVALIVGFGAMAIVGLAQTVGNGLFNTATPGT